LGRIWIGGSESIARFEQGQVQTINGEGGAAITDVRYFAEHPTDRSIWAVSDRGAFRFTESRFQAVNGPGGKPLTEVNCLRFEADGTLWVGTRHAGLFRLRKQTWASLTLRDGLPSDSILSLLEDGQGFFWIGSNRGIARVAKAACYAVIDGRQPDLNCQVFTVSDGLASVECSAGVQPNATTDSQGRLWFATLKGVAVVDPRRIQVNTNPPPVLIERVEYRDQTSVLHELPYHGQAQLVAPPGTRQFVVYFNAPAYSAPEKMRFRYTIDQPRGNWVEVSDRRSVEWPTPVPGTTHYRIKAANSDGIWNETGVSLALTVPPFYWQTLWFRFLAALAALVGVGGTVWRVQHYKLSRQREQFNQERALAQERARLASVLEGTTDFVGFTAPNGGMLYINRAGRLLAGLTETEDIAQIKMSDLFLPASTELLQQTAIPQASRSGTWSGETMLKRRDGLGIPVSQVIVAHRNAEGQLLFVSTIIRDTTERKRAEEALRASLAEKTTLLKEVHHRVKNNLQIVSSLLNLQAGHVQDATVLELLTVTRSRVGAMALLHENLYQSENFARLNLPEYVESLCAQLLRAAGPVHARVRLERHVDSETVALGLDQAVPCGLLLNELVTNALKHAFPGERSGCIRVTLERATPQTARLTVADDGVGLPATLDPRHSASLGLQLVFLLTQQLHGTVNFERGQGTAVHILLPNSAEKETPHA
ncbi:MAG: PAS domain S-box protein, partial [Verrucomicrobia bacterium]|nr:PAS domain S-box protein [Verrucomicrobiota bacterium]